MGLHSPHVMSERVLVFGGTGAGKTRALLDIARWCHKTNSDARFYVIDTEGAWPRMMEPELSERVILEVMAANWQGYWDNLKKFAEVVQPGDFVVVDSISPAWQKCQDYFSTEVYGDDLSSVWMRKAREWEAAGKGKGGPLPETDWGIVNGQWRRFLDLLFAIYLERRCHIFMTAYSDEVRDADAESIKELFPLGVKPKGQKELAHWFDTVLWLKQGRGGAWVATTFKDREVAGENREYLKGADMERGFVKTWAMEVAGWKLA